MSQQNFGSYDESTEFCQWWCKCGRFGTVMLLVTEECQKHQGIHQCVLVADLPIQTVPVPVPESVPIPLPV